MLLSRRDLEEIDLESMRPYASDLEEFFGKGEHYRLLAYLASCMPAEKIIIDIGTHRGNSAVAMASSGKMIESFDVVHKLYPGAALPRNVHCNLQDLFDPNVRDVWREMLLSSSLIFVDVDPHEGRVEYELVRWLQDNHYGGFIVLDDIWHFKGMRDNLWSQLEPEIKTDVTELGHWAGTGIVSFRERVEIVQ